MPQQCIIITTRFFRNCPFWLISEFLKKNSDFWVFDLATLVGDNEEIFDDDNFDAEWSRVAIESTSTLPLESTVESRFDVWERIARVAADVDEGFGIWSSIFCFFVGDDEKKDEIVLSFEELDLINVIVYINEYFNSL